MQWIDGHLDLAYLALNGRDLTQPCREADDACISLPDLRAGHVQTVLGTIYTEKNHLDDPCGYGSSDDREGANAAGRAELEYYKILEAKHEINIIKSVAELNQTHHADILQVILLMEGADPIKSPENVQFWWDAGVRIVGLTWATGSRYAGGNALPGPLTEEGCELISALDEVGMIHDISHLADEAVDELLNISASSVIASHSNVRALMQIDNQRHLRDEHIHAIVQRGGMIGLNLYQRFLSQGNNATVQDAVQHVEYICNLVGSCAYIGLGSDADGGFGASSLPKELNHPAKWYNLLDELGRVGWTQEELEGFAYRNWQRVITESLPE